MRNIWFRRLNMRQKAVAAAREALEAIESGELIPSTGAYADLHDAPTRSVIEVVLGQRPDLQRVLSNTKCNVCAIGAAFAAVARLGDGCTTRRDRTFVEANTVFAMASLAFHDQELVDMEYLFELCECRQRTPTQAAMSRFPEYEALNSRGRMKRIMETVILNDGSFLGGKERIEEIQAQQAHRCHWTAEAAWATPEPNSL